MLHRSTLSRFQVCSTLLLTIVIRLYFRSPEHTHLIPFHQCLSSSPFSSPKTKYFILFFYSFIYLWLHWVFVAMCRLSLVAVHRLWALGLQYRGLIACGSQALGCAGFSNWHVGLVTPQHIESFRPGIKPMSPALLGGFLSTVSARKSQIFSHSDRQEKPK